MAALAACSVGPAYKRPDIPVPAKWHDPTAHEDSAVWPTPDWWHAFGSQKLDELITEAMRSNDDLGVAVARVQEADAQARIAGAPLLPSLDLGASATRQRAPVSGLGPQVYNVFNPELTASYELDFWGKNRAARRAARATAVASRYDQQTVALTVVSSVATTYFQALELRDRIEVARQNLENGQKVLDGLRLQADGRHRDRTRCRAAGNCGGAVGCGNPAIAATVPPDGECAGRADRQDAGVARCGRRHAHYL